MGNKLHDIKTVHTDFTEALMHLYTENNLEDISVVMLCKKAGYSRSTFYRNFNTIDDVMQELEESAIPYQSMNYLLSKSSTLEMEEITNSFLKALVDHKDKYRALFTHDKNMRFTQKLKAVMRPVFRSQAERVFDMKSFEYDVLAEYLTMAKISLLRIWAVSSADYDLAYLTKITDATIERSLWDGIDEANQCRKEGREFKRVTINELAETRPWIAHRYGSLHS